MKGQAGPSRLGVAAEKIRDKSKGARPSNGETGRKGSLTHNSEGSQSAASSQPDSRKVHQEMRGGGKDDYPTASHFLIATHGLGTPMESCLPPLSYCPYLHHTINFISTSQHRTAPDLARVADWGWNHGHTFRRGLEAANQCETTAYL